MLMMASINLDPLYQVLKIVTDIMPIGVTIGLVLFVIGLIFYMILGRGGGGKLVNSLRIDKKMLYPMIAMTLMIFMALAMAPQAGAATESFSNLPTIIYAGTTVTLEIDGLTVGTEYTIWATGNSATIANITFTASSSTQYIPFGVPSDSDNHFTLNIATSTAGVAATADATLYISLTDPGNFLLTDFFFNILVPIILILIVVGILVGIKTGVVGGGKGPKGM